MRASISLIAIDFQSAWAANADEYLHKGLAVHDQYRDHSLITTVFGPHAPYTVSDAALEKIRMYADELDVQIQMHVHETAHEVDDSVKQSGERPLAHLQKLGLVTPRLMAVHMTQLSDAEIVMLSASGAHVVHCPEFLQARQRTLTRPLHTVVNFVRGFVHVHLNLHVQLVGIHADFF